MVERQLRGRGIRDPRVLDAFERIPRHVFVPEREQEIAYADSPLPIGSGQTISQPLMVAEMLQEMELRGDERVLDVGAGSGYQTALLTCLARDVVAIERLPELAERARKALLWIGITNAEVVVGDGSVGYAPRAPYDAIVVGAAAPEVPPALLEQLADGGRLLIPVGDRFGQVLLRIRRRGARYAREQLTLCTFVPLVGAQGWSE